MKLCKDCRWVRWPLYPPGMPLRSYEATCDHHSSLYQAPADVVTGGQPPPRRLACQTARLNLFENTCGKRARYWEAGSHFKHLDD